MEFAGFACVAVFAAVSFFVTERRLHAYEYLASYLVSVSLIVTCIDILNPLNSEFLNISKAPQLYWTMRLFEISLVPLACLFYLESMHVWRSFVWKAAATLLCVGILFGMESVLVWRGILVYDEWHFWWSWPAWFVFLIVVYATQQGMRRLLQREGAVA